MIRALHGVNAPEFVGISPTNTVAPAISSNGVNGAGGPAVENDTLSLIDNGTWTASPSPTFTYQWVNGSGDIVGETTGAHTVTSADVSASSVWCRVTASNGVSPDASANSNTINTTV